MATTQNMRYEDAEIRHHNRNVVWGWIVGLVIVVLAVIALAMYYNGQSQNVVNSGTPGSNTTPSAGYSTTPTSPTPVTPATPGTTGAAGY